MIEQLKIYDYENKNLVRLGNTEHSNKIGGDGGYLIDQLSLNKSYFCLTFGVSDDVSFEIDYHKLTGKNSYTFDHTINQDVFEKAAGQLSHKHIFWKKEGLGSGENLKSLTEHLKSLPEGNFIFKVDIEEAEYDFFKTNQIEEHYKRISAVVIEFHWLQKDPYQSMFIESMKKLDKYFYLTHMHGNNNSGIFKYNNNVLPEVIELTFINKELINSPFTVPYKYHKLDQRCNKKLKEIDMRI